MIIETIVSTISKKNIVNFAPFGIKRTNKFIFISPYVPSVTLQNLLDNKFAAINYIDESEYFVNCIIGKKNFKKKKCKLINAFYLENCLSYDEVEVINFTEDLKRPTFKCRILLSRCIKPFKGFNRARSALLEACILASRTKFLKKKKIMEELKYLSNAIIKTSGKKELDSWKKINQFINSCYTKK